MRLDPGARINQKSLQDGGYERRAGMEGEGGKNEVVGDKGWLAGDATNYPIKK